MWGTQSYTGVIEAATGKVSVDTIPCGALKDISYCNQYFTLCFSGYYSMWGTQRLKYNSPIEFAAVSVDTIPCGSLKEQ